MSEHAIEQDSQISPSSPPGADAGDADRTARPPQQTTPPAESRLVPRLLMGLLALAVIYSLAMAQRIAIPIALAFLLSLVLAPVVRWLERLHLSRGLGAGAVVLVLLSGLGYGVTSFIDPVTGWMDRAPSMLRQLERKIYPIKKTVEEVSKTAEQVDRIASVGAKDTVKVQGLSFKDMLYSNARGLTTGLLMTTFLLYFFLSWGQALWLKVARLIHHTEHRNQFLELSRVLEGEVSRYLLIITTINLGLGVAVAATLFAFGVPDPVLWGTAAALLNFVPYVGSLLTALLIGVTSLLAFDGLTMPGLVVACFMLLTTLEGQVITPLVLGQRLSLNPLVVFLAVVFWFWLWGVAGALMAVPMLITVKLVGDRVPPLRPFAVVTSR